MRDKSFAKNIIRKLIMLALVAGAFVALGGASKAMAASVTVKEIDYDKSQMTVTLGAQDSCLYVSDSKARKWEVMAEGTGDVTIDLSWITMTKDYTLSLKGDVSKDVVKVLIPKQTSTFKATFNLLTSKVTFQNVPVGRTIQWRKKESLQWTTYEESDFSVQSESLCANGAVIYFRLAQAKGTSASSAGARPSKEVSISIPKKIAAPTIKIDDNSLTITLAKGTQYRYLQSETGNPVMVNGVYVDWVDVNQTTEMKLSVLAKDSLYSDTNTTPSSLKKTYIQFRTKQTSSKQMSLNTTITVPVQQDKIENDDKQVELKYTGSTTFQIKVKSASAAEPYQYCLLDKDTWNGANSIDDIDPKEITWKDITSSTPISFDKDKDKIEEGTRVYVRKKALYSQGNVDYKLASPAYPLTDSNGIKYPGKATVENGFVWLQTVAGICNPSNPNGNITFTMYSPAETTIKSIKFVKYDDLTTVGECTVTSSVAENASPANDNQKYIITTTIKSTAAIDSCTRTRMLAYITYESGSVYESTKTEGIGMYIYPASKVDNPADKTEKVRVGNLFYGSYDVDSDYVDYSTAFERVYLSNKYYTSNESDPNYGKYTHDNEDDRDFKFILKLGSVLKKDTGILSNGTTPKLTYDVSGEAGTLIEVSSLKYDSVVLDKSYYSVSYAIDKDSENNDVRLALVTIHCDKLEQDTNIDDRNKATNLIIYLNNGEILDDAVTLNLVKTATIDASPISWSLTPSTLEVTRTVTTTTSGGATTTTTEKVYDYIIDLTLFKSNYSVAIEDVTWNGISVYDKADVGNGKIKLYLSNEKIKNLGASLEKSATHYLNIKLTNGFVISDDCQMTLLKGN